MVLVLCVEREGGGGALHSESLLAPFVLISYAPFSWLFTTCKLMSVSVFSRIGRGAGN